MTEQPLQVAIIVGSNREGRFGPTVARWFAGQAGQRHDLTLDVIDLADVDLPVAFPRHFSPGVESYLERIDAADAFVIVTPEYNHGYPAPLKQAIDLALHQWRAKPVAFVSYGGMSGGLRAVEQLRQVFAELHAVTIRDTVSFHGAHGRFDDAGNPLDPVGCNSAAKVLLDELTWWALALREARSVRPYRS